MPTNPLVLANRFRAQLTKLDAQQMQQLLAAYAPIRASLDAPIDALLMEIEIMGAPTALRVRRSSRFNRLIDTIAERLAEFSLLLLVVMRSASGQGFTLGAQNGATMLSQFGTKATGVSPAAIEQLAAFLDPSGALYKRIQILAPYTAQRVADAILDGVSLGQNPRIIAAAINRNFGMGLTDAMRMTRTVQIYSYRYATHASFIANGVEQWQWFSRLDPGRTCMSCVAQHGTLHPASETLNDHHNGLCIAIPVVGGAELVRERGEDWWSAQDEVLQRQMMGAGKFEAWKDGAFEFAALSTTHDDPVYGIMRTAAPLKELLK